MLTEYISEALGRPLRTDTDDYQESGPSNEAPQTRWLAIFSLCLISWRSSLSASASMAA